MMHPRFRFRTLLLLGSVLIPVTFASPVLAQVTAPEGEEELLSLPPVDDAAQPSEAAPVVAPLETQAPIPAPSPEPIPEPPAAVESEEPAAALEPLPEPVAAPEAAPAVEMEAAPPAPAMPDNADALPEAPLPVAGGTEPEGDVVDAAADGAPDATAATATSAASALLRTDLTAERPWGSTLMFPAKNLSDLITIYDVYLANQAKLAPKTSVDGKPTISLPDMIKKMQADGKEVPEEVLVLTLNSIVYSNPNDWSVWLNGKRYFRQDALDGFVADSSTLRVTAISKESATLVWTPVPESINRIAGHWQVRQASADLPKPALMARGERVNFNDDASVTITLTPNQTFLSQQMAVFEGKVSPREAEASIQRAAQKSKATAAVANGGAVPADAVVPPVAGGGNTLIQPPVNVPNHPVPPQAPGYQVAPAVYDDSSEFPDRPE